MNMAAAANANRDWEPERRAVGGEPRKVHVIQGEFHVSDEPDLVLTTILGSCVAACVRDPVAGVGGMNHFLLPGETGAEKGAGEGLRYGVQSMELLVNALLRRGARRERLEVKLFGGARLIEGLTDVGSQNAAFAERFVRDEGLQAAGGSLRGQQARRIQFWPVSGRARQVLLEAAGSKIFAAERPRTVATPPPEQSGALELF
jgi:chemotaxis protein CheD